MESILAMEPTEQGYPVDPHVEVAVDLGNHSFIRANGGAKDNLRYLAFDAVAPKLRLDSFLDEFRHPMIRSRIQR